MSSPEVWASARAIIEAEAERLALPVAWPNEIFGAPEPYDIEGVPSKWVAVEISGDTLEQIELGPEGAWEETGMVQMHVMIPAGSGIMTGLTLRKALSNAFRALPPAPVVYRDGALFDPGGPGDTDGNWHRLTVRVPYSYQDKPMEAGTQP